MDNFDRDMRTGFRYVILLWIMGVIVSFGFWVGLIYFGVKLAKAAWGG